MDMHFSAWMGATMHFVLEFCDKNWEKARPIEKVEALEKARPIEKVEALEKNDKTNPKKPALRFAGLKSQTYWEIDSHCDSQFLQALSIVKRG